MKKVQKEGKEDELLILFVAILTLAGLFFLYSTGTYNGKVKFGDAGYYLKKQLFASVLAPIAIPYKSPETLIKWGFPAFFHEMKKLKYSLFFSLS